MANLSSIWPSFIVSDLKNSVSFYLDKLGFELRYMGPDGEPYWAIVGRDNVSIMLKVVAPETRPVPNHGRHEYAPWDAYIFTAEPDNLYNEYCSRNVSFHKAIQNNSDNLRGFEVLDADGYLLFFGRPNS